MGRMIRPGGEVLDRQGKPLPVYMQRHKTWIWMKEHKSEYRETRTDEFNMTRMAEDACYALNYYEGDEIPEWMFDLAYGVCDDTSC